MISARPHCAVLAAMCLLWPGVAIGQRVQFPSALPTEMAPATGFQGFQGTTVPAPPSAVYGSPGGVVTGPMTGGTMLQGPMPGATLAPAAPGSSAIMPPATLPPGAEPGYFAQPPVYSPGAAPGYGTPPAATFQGGIQPPPSWDPYGAPGAQAPTLLPQDPSVGGMNPYPQGTMSSMLRVMQEIDLTYVWMPNASGPDELGYQEFITSATFAIPCFYNQQTPLLVTPGFGLHLFDGPIDPDMPGQTYDAFLDVGWNPQITPLIGAELGARVGVFTDFENVRAESLRVLGRGLVTFALSPSFQLKAGVLYLDRLRVKLLPAGGVVWTPQNYPDLRFEILFPNPKLSMRVTTYRNTDWWVYLRGEYGGGSWTIDRHTPAVVPDEVDYNDIRIALGAEWDRYGISHGFFEVGAAFARELVYKSGDVFEPGATVFLGAGVAF